MQRTICLATLGCLISGVAVASSDTSSTTNSAELAIRSALLSVPPEKRQAVLSRASSGLVKQPTNSAEKAQASVTTKTARAAAISDGSEKSGLAFLDHNMKGSAFRKARCPGLNIVLRQDWKDVGWDWCPDPVDMATGASISYTNDRTADNKSWSIRGTAAGLYNIFNPAAVGLTPYRATMGLYVTENRLTNSSETQLKSNANSTSYGGVGIFAFQTTSDWTNYVRIRGGGTSDYVKDTTSVQITGEWLPVYGPLNIDAPFQPIPVVPITARFEPTLFARYDGETGNKKGLGFNDRSTSLRFGPQLYVKFMPTAGVDTFWARFNGSISYRWEYETYSVSYLRWFDASVTYNLDPNGFMGLSLIYQNGRDEDTGAATDILKFALTGKI